MEMREWLRRLGRLSWLLVIVPVLAASVAVVYGLVRVPDYTATATVTLSAPDGSTTGAALSAATTGFVDAAHSEKVLAAAAEESGVPAGEIESDTTATRVGDSPQVQLVYTGDRHDGSVEKLLRSQVVAAVAEVYAPGLRTAAARVSAAETRVSTADKVVADLRKKTGSDVPLEEYRAKANEVTQIRVAIVTAKANDKSTGALDQALAEAQKDLKKLAELSAQFEGPLDEASKARDGLQSAKATEDDLEARKTAATTADSVNVTDVEPGARMTAALRLGVSALVVAFGLVVALLVAVSLLRRGPLQVRPRAAKPDDRVEERV